MDCFVNWGKFNYFTGRIECFISDCPLVKAIKIYRRFLFIGACLFLLAGVTGIQSEAAANTAAFVSAAGERSRDKKNFSLHVKEAPLAAVLEGLAAISGKNLILPGSISGTVTADLHDVTPEEALRWITESHGYILQQEGPSFIVFSGQKKQEAGNGVKVFRLSYADAEETASSLENMFPNSHVSCSSSANTVIVSGPPLALLQAASVISQLDIPEKQVKVEAEVVAVNRSYAKDLGIDWDFKSLTGSAGYDRDQWSETVDLYDKDGSIRYDKNGYPKTRNIEHSGWKVTAPDGYAGISYGRSIMGHPYTFFFQAQLNALISKGKAKILARPSVATMNGRKAEILIGSKIPVSVEHTVNGEKTATIEYKDAGIKLSYTPRISQDGEITADVKAEVSTPYLVPEVKAYRIVTRQANTMVRLHSGDMLTIGGLIDKEETRTVRKVPILSEIPLLGKLFQSKHTSVDESEIIIIIRADLI